MKSNLRQTPLYITGEQHSISNQLVRLEEACQKDSVSIVGYTEVYTEPQQGQFQVLYGKDAIDRDIGLLLKFNALDNDKAITVNYFGMGSIIWAEDWNELNNRLDLAETATIGPTIDTIIPIPSNAKGQVNVGLAGQSLSQLIKYGDVATNITSDATGTTIGISKAGNFTFNTSYDSNLQTINMINGHKYFAYFKTKTGNFRDFVVIRYSDGSFQVLGTSSADNVKNEVFKTFTCDNSNLANVTIAEGDSGTIERDYQMLIDMTANGIEDYTEEQMLQLARLGYWNGTKSTVSHRIKSFSGNWFNKNNVIDGGFINTSGGVSSSIDWLYSDYQTIKPNTQYRKTISTTIAFYDINKNFISCVTNNLFITPTNAYYYRDSLPKDLYDENTYMIVEGSTMPTTFVKHEFSNLYITLPEGVDGLYSVDSAYDEVKDDKLYKRLKKLNFINFDDWFLDINYDSFFTDIDTYSDLDNPYFNNGGAILYNNDGYFQSFVGYTPGGKQKLAFRLTEDYLTSKGYTFGSIGARQWAMDTGITLIYQLAQEKVYDLNIIGSLKAYPGGYLIVEPYLRKSYNTDTTSIALDLPISSIDKLQKFENANWVDASGTLSTDGKTITGLTAGTYRVEGPIRPEENVNGEITVKYGTNLAAYIQSIEELAMKNAFIIAEHDMMLLTLAIQMVELQGGAA